MKKETWNPVDLTQATTYPLSERENKVSIQDFAQPILQAETTALSIDGLLASMPRILKGGDLRDLIDFVISAHRQQKPVIVMLGGHVIKCGLSPILIDSLSDCSKFARKLPLGL